MRGRERGSKRRRRAFLNLNLNQKNKTQFENPATGVTHRYWFENPNVGMPVREDGGGGVGGAGRLMPRECREMVRRLEFLLPFFLFLSSFPFSFFLPPSFLFSERAFCLSVLLFLLIQKTSKNKNREPPTKPPSPSTSAGPRHLLERRSRSPTRPRPRAAKHSTASPAGWALFRLW